MAPCWVQYGGRKEVLLTQHFRLGLAPVLDKRVEQWGRRGVEAARRDSAAQVAADPHLIAGRSTLTPTPPASK
jgi:hypothetical protein